MYRWVVWIHSWRGRVSGVDHIIRVDHTPQSAMERTTVERSTTERSATERSAKRSIYYGAIYYGVSTVSYMMKEVKDIDRRCATADLANI